MEDEFLTQFWWIGDLLKRPITEFFAEGSREHQILSRLQADWGRCDTAALLRQLDADYGVAAGETVQRYLELNIRRDWTEVGRKKAGQGTEVEDFIRLLWEPLRDGGFEYAQERAGATTALRVTRCPVHELAEKTGMHAWLYRLACHTDFVSTPAFSPKIAFTRTKTLIQGHGYCDHRYTRA